MLTQRLANIVFAILVLLAAAYFVNAAVGFEDNKLLGSEELSSSFFPLVTLIFVIVCALIVLLQYLRGSTVDIRQSDKVYKNWREALSGALTYVVALACYVIWSYYGFIPAALIIGPAAAFVMGVRSIPLYAFLVASGYFIYLVFRYLLSIQLS